MREGAQNRSEIERWIIGTAPSRALFSGGEESEVERALVRQTLLRVRESGFYDARTHSLHEVIELFGRPSSRAEAFVDYTLSYPIEAVYRWSLLSENEIESGRICLLDERPLSLARDPQRAVQALVPLMTSERRIVEALGEPYSQSEWWPQTAYRFHCFDSTDIEVWCEHGVLTRVTTVSGE